MRHATVPRGGATATYRRVGLVALLLAVVAACGHSSPGSSPDSSTGGSGARTGTPSETVTPVAGRTTRPPWPVPDNEVAYISAAGLPPLTEERVDVHYHAHLDIFDNGRQVPVAAGIGIDEAKQRISPLHSHDATGVVHIESPKRDRFTVGQLFTEWNVRLTKDCVGGLCAGAGTRLRFYVNGQPYGGDPRGIVFAAHQEIAIIYGTPPAKIPSSYDFNGL